MKFAASLLRRRHLGHPDPHPALLHGEPDWPPRPSSITHPAFYYGFDGADRILYSVDFPYEDMGEAASWFDKASISEPDRLKIASRNARQLFRL